MRKSILLFVFALVALNVSAKEGLEEVYIGRPIEITSGNKDLFYCCNIKKVTLGSAVTEITDGRGISAPQKGLNIIRQNGTVKKILVK